LDGWPQGVNPFRLVDKFPEERSPRCIPPEEDFWKVDDVANGQDRVMLLAYLHLAARRGEIFGLTWRDVDFGVKRIRLWTRKRDGGNKEFDWLPMTSELRKAIARWWDERPFKETAYVFVCLERSSFCEEYYGKPFKVRQHVMKRLCHKAGVKPFGFHAIRHLTASILYRKGYAVALIQAVLRQKDPNTTSQYLRKLGLEQVRDALEQGLRRPAKVIPFQKKTLGGGISEG
jgi:integrase